MHPLKRRVFIPCALALLVALLAVPLAGTQAQVGIILQVALPEYMRGMIPKDVFAQFEADNPGITVQPVYISPENLFVPRPADDLDEHLTSVSELVSLADVIGVNLESNSALTAAATRAGYFLDLAPLTNADASLAVDDFLPAAWQSVQWDGGIWALPVSLDVITVAYNPAAFDAAGLAYPNGSWTLDDFANAARALTQRDASGAVTTPGLVTFGNTALLLRSLLNQPLDDGSNNPRFATPELESLLTAWVELEQEAVVSSSFNGEINSAPLRIMNSFALAAFQGSDSDSPPAGALLPNNTAGLDVQAVVVSSGTAYREPAYALAKYMTQSAVFVNNPLSMTPARHSLEGVEPTTNTEGPGIRFGARDFSPENQAVIDQALASGLPYPEMLHAGYLSLAPDKMQQDGMDALSALQAAEAQAVTDLQTAATRRSTTVVTVATPVPEVVLQPGEISLNFGVFSNIQPFPNRERWEELMRQFAESDPQVGKVNLQIPGFGGTSAEEMAEQYDCFYLPYNGVPNLELDSVLNLDPFLDVDPSFDRSDVVGNALAQMQRENKTWALPVVIQPSALRYNSEQFARAGVPEPANGWTITEFADALRALKDLPDAPVPFSPRDPGGEYLMLLIAAYGGIPLDYRTEPPTVNFTDPATVSAIRQVLDLAKQGYLEYQELARTQFSIIAGGDTQYAIFTDSMSGPGEFRMVIGGDGSNPYKLATYPRGSQYAATSYGVTTAYISATSQNPDACYRWISTLAQHPELFNGMPTRRSLINDPAYVAQVGADAVAFYNQYDGLMQDANTVVFPSQFFANEAGPGNFLLRFWLNRAFDRYVMQDADLEAELTDAQTLVTAYQQCAANIPPLDEAAQDQREYTQQFFNCATTADPTMTSFFGQP